MDMIAIIEDKLNKKAKINFLPMQPGDVLESHADIEYSKNKLGYDPKISIDKGINTFLEWYKSYYEH